VKLNEALASAAGAFAPARVTGIALNGWGFSDQAIEAEIRNIEKETGLPCCDVVRSGGGKLLDTIV